MNLTFSYFRFMYRYFLYLFVSSVLLGACAQPDSTSSVASSQKLQSLDWLLKDDSLYRHVEVNETGVALYASEEDREAGRVECRIYPQEYALTAQLFRTLSPDSLLKLYLQKGLQKWSQILGTEISVDTLLPFAFDPNSPQPMKGLKIAIDPGHVSDNMEDAELEGKYMKMKKNKREGTEAVAFFEPRLTLATAWLIRDSLEKLGAEVMMTREVPGVGVRGKTFEEWKEEDKDSILQAEAIEKEWSEEDLDYWLKKAGDKELFKFFYNADDLRARAEKINAFRPDVTVIIHYNIHSPNWDARDAEGYFRPVDTNYAMVFIPGGFIRNELGKPEDRLALLRMLVTDDVKHSYTMAKSYMYQTEKITGVPAVGQDSKLPYLDVFSIYTETPGVYARNLSLTRSVWGPLVYGESLCQDSRSEVFELNRQDFEVHGVGTSPRLVDMAHAYIGTVWAYARIRHQEDQ